LGRETYALHTVVVFTTALTVAFWATVRESSSRVSTRVKTERVTALGDLHVLFVVSFVAIHQLTRKDFDCDYRNRGQLKEAPEFPDNHNPASCVERGFRRGRSEGEGDEAKSHSGYSCHREIQHGTRTTPTTEEPRADEASKRKVGSLKG